MEKVAIQGTSLEAHRITLGTWSLGGWQWGGTEERQALDTLRAALDRGLTSFDTAPIYGRGRSEELLGKILAERGNREQVFLATKAGLEWHDDRVRRNSSRPRLRREIEDSLRRLRTDYIDLYQVHWPDPEVPIEETAEVMEELHAKGKVRALGVCNYSPEEMDRFRELAPLHTSQPPYNLFERGCEQEVLPYCRQHHITTLVYGALCRGLLSGTMTKDRSFAQDDIRRLDPKFQPPRLEQYLRAVEALDRFAQQHYGKRVIHLALRWLLDQPGVHIALWGPRKPEQLEPLDEVEGWTLDDHAKKQIDRILEEAAPRPLGPDFLSPPTRRAHA